MKVRDYKELKVWQKGIEITDSVYSITNDYPKSEFYALTNQMRRSAVSIPSNIAEGFVRNHSGEYKQFLYIALGSCAELETQLIISQRRAYIDQNLFNDNLQNVLYEMRMLINLIKQI